MNISCDPGLLFVHATWWPSALRNQRDDTKMRACVVWDGHHWGSLELYLGNGKGNLHEIHGYQWQPESHCELGPKCQSFSSSHPKMSLQHIVAIFLLKTNRYHHGEPLGRRFGIRFSGFSWPSGVHPTQVAGTFTDGFGDFSGSHLMFGLSAGLQALTLHPAKVTLRCLDPS